MKIEIVTTPNDEMKETGFGTLKACYSIYRSIKKMGYDVKLNQCTTEYDLKEVVKRKPDLVIVAVKYLSLPNSKKIWLSAYFEENEINFSGSSVEILKFDSDKVLAKAFLIKKGIKTAQYFTAVPGEYTDESMLPLKYPLFLKPMDAANGNGIDDLSFVNSFAEFESKVSSLYRQYSLPVLAEEYLDGKEFTVGVISTKNSGFIVSPIEVVPLESGNGLRILGEKAKKDDLEELKKSENHPMTEKIKELAVDVFTNLGIRDFARIDIKTNQNGECFFMEANLVPGMTDLSSYFPKAFEIEHQLSYDDVIHLILENGIGRVPLRSTTRILIHLLYKKVRKLSFQYENLFKRNLETPVSIKYQVSSL